MFSSLAQEREHFEHRYWLQSQGYDIKRFVGKVSRIFEIEPEGTFQMVLDGKMRASCNFKKICD